MKTVKIRRTGGLAVAALLVAGAVRAASFDVASGEVKTLDDSTVRGYDAASVAAGGVLVFDTSEAPPFAVTGAGVVRKANAATWTMAAANDEFAGTWELVGGVVQSNPSIPNPFGKSDASGGPRVVVTNGATLAIMDSAASYGSMQFLIGGDGVDGRGALEFAAGVVHTDGYMIRNVALAEDATLTLKRGCVIIVAGGAFDLNGRKLTLTGGGGLHLLGARISERGEWLVTGEPGLVTTLLFRSWNSGSPAGGVTDADEMRFTLGGFATLGFYNRYQPFSRPLQVRGQGNTLSHQEQFPIAEDRTHAHQAWRGPITFLAEEGALAELTVSVGSSACGFALPGKISGPGSLAFAGNGCIFIENAANDYTGGTAFGNGTYVLGARSSIPALVPEDVPLDLVWTNGNLVLSEGETGALTARQINVRNAKPNDWSTALTLAGADVTLAKGGFWGAGVGTPPDYYTYNSRLVVTNTLVRAEDLTQKDTFNKSNPAYASMSNSLVVGQGAFGTLEIEAGSVISNRLQVGLHGNAIWDNVSFGAVRQRGGRMVAVDPDNSFLKGSALGVGQSCGGYYELSGGELVTHGSFSVGASGAGALWMRGGSLVATNVLSSSSVGRFELGSFNGGHGSLRVSGGTFRYHGDSDLFVGRGWTSNAVQVLTVDGADAVCDFGEARLNFGYGNYGGSTFCVNLNGGVLTVGQFYKHSNENRHLENRLYVNFDGGTFRAGGKSNAEVFGVGAFGADRITVYAGGATFDTDGRDIFVRQPIQSPTGPGLASISLAAPIPHASSPAVRIQSETGSGASAFAHYDWDTHTIDRIDLLSAGVGYEDAAVTLYFASGQTRTIDAANVTFAAQATGGALTKTGQGTLTLSAVNTWAGATCVRGGTLKTACDGALPAGTDVILAGGATLDLDDTAQRIASVTYQVGGGEIVNAGQSALPTAVSLAISVEEILSGQAIELPGDFDLSTVTLTVMGAFPAEMPTEMRYPFVTTTGRWTGTPTIVAPALPKGWLISVGSRRITFKPAKGGLLILR